MNRTRSENRTRNEKEVDMHPDPEEAKPMDDTPAAVSVTHISFLKGLHNVLSESNDG